MADKSLEEIKRGEQAAVILDNPVYQDAINRVRENIVNSMTNSAIGDEKTHNRLVIALQLLNQIKMPLLQILILLCLSSAVCTMGLVVGESIATKNPNTRFTKWWRRNVIGIMN